MNEAKARQSRRWSSSPAATLLLILTCLAGVALLAKGLYPVDLPSAKNPDFIDTAFDNRAVLWTARLLLVSAAAVLAVGGVFIVASIGIRTKNGEWLKRAGPFEVSEVTVGEVEGRIDLWRTAALVSQEKVVELTERLEESDEVIEQLRTVFASASMVGREHA
ncbi:MAG TPA: hypothetical protein VFX35_06585 [Solirubrobacterales bacterium]|nr:hypothetical protein [Solirubrobacterales bacterium]